MIAENYKESIPLPSGVTAYLVDATLTIKGQKGDVIRNFLHPKVSIKVSGTAVEFSAARFAKGEKKILNTFVAHVKNMYKGASLGHEYKLKICSGHFPMNVSIKGKNMEVKNFIGEAVPRRMTFKDGATVKMDGEIITVTGIDKEIVGQTAASIETLCRRNGFDKRIFQDGIFIIEKDGKAI